MANFAISTCLPVSLLNAVSEGPRCLPMNHLNGAEDEHRVSEVEVSTGVPYFFQYCRGEETITAFGSVRALRRRTSPSWPLST